MVNIERLVLYVIVIVVGLILLAQFMPGGQFQKVKSTFNNVKSYLPEIGIGAEQVHAGEISIPSEHRQSLVSLQAAIQKVLYSEKRNCFTPYQPFSELGEKGTTIDFEYDAAKMETKVVIRRGKINQQQEATDETFNIIGMKPCVIAGATSIVENFDHAFLNRAGAFSSYFTDVNFIRIMYDDPWFGNNENRIAFGNSPDQLTTFYDFEGDGWLFTPDNTVGNKHICFFPTQGWVGGSCSANGNALDPDCFTRTAALVGQAITDEQLALQEEQRQEQRKQTIINIPAFINQGVLDQC
ncbi:MAG: hypothetical protein Q7K45_02435 [Nanoarchaeota archaeon]|nr:hypothetical protein [Nanoarchaeota archaeon]